MKRFAIVLLCTLFATPLRTAGKVVRAGSGAKFQISGSNEILALVPESSAISAPSATVATAIVDGTIPEAVKGKSPESIRYHSLSEEKQK